MDAATLEALRENQELYLTDTCTVLTATDVSSGFGGDVTTWNLGTSYPCRITEERQPIEKSEGDRTASVILYRIFLPWDAVVSSQDRLRVSGIDYEPFGDTDQVSERLTLQVVCRRL